MNIIEYLKQAIAPYFGEFEKSEKYINKKISYSEVFLIFLTISIIGSILGEIINPDPEFQIFSTDILSTFLVLIGIIILIPIGILISVLIQHLFLKLVGGKAKFTQTLKFSNSISIFPLVIFSVLGIIPIFLIKNELISTIISSIILLLAVIFLIWSFIVSVKVFSKIHKISIGKAVLAMFLPIIIMLTLLIISIIIAVTFGVLSI